MRSFVFHQGHSYGACQSFKLQALPWKTHQEESKALSPYCSFLGQLEHLNPTRLSFQKTENYAYKDNKFQKMLSFLKSILFQISYVSNL